MTRRLAGLSLPPLIAWALVGLLGAGRAVAAPSATPAELARYRDAHALLAGGEYAAAQATFEALPPDFLLADYASFFAAESLLRGGDDATALERFRVYPERFPDTVLAPAALLAAHDTAFRLGRFADAEREARRFLQRWPAHPEAGRILVRLAEARAAQGQVAEALADLRRRWLEAPASAWGEVARESMEDLARRSGLAVAPFTPDEQYAQAVRFMDASEFSAAAALLGELLARDPEPPLRHRTVLRLAQALRRLGKSADAVPIVQTALAEPATGWRPELLYELTRLQTRTGQSAAAVPVLERLLAEHADAKVAPDAWLSLARLRLELGQAAAARLAFQGLLTAHPEHAVAASARWELAWLEYRAQRFRDAVLAFRQLSSSVVSFRLAGLYWAARSLEAAREPAAASALLKDVQARGPQTYYGVLAERRLRSRAPPPPVAASVRLAADPLAALAPDPHFQKARALAGLGFQGAALTELETLVREPGVEPDRAWGLGVAFAQFGEAGRSLRQLRRAFGAAAEGGAAGLTPAFWRLFYPLGYADHVRAAAQRAGVDPFFVAAVIREESSYDPRAKSWVGAIGLMQLMPETARVLASDLRLPLGDPAELWEPPLNITLGAAYLGQLRARFGEPLLAAASYNAGPHRVDRWLAERRTPDLEEFVDQIPFDETRAFVKRVASSWHQYRRLYGPPESGGPTAGTSTWGARTRP
jgi:soluble lytic murein transglycosylase